jgi:hypothetical protein
MAHYFDDIFHRHVGAKTPATPRSPEMPRIRRSSTARSISARSDFSRVDLNGYSGDEGGDEEDESVYTPRRGSVGGNSVMLDDPRRARERAEADAHMHNYISEQLERVRSEQAEGLYESEEFEAHVE